MAESRDQPPAIQGKHLVFLFMAATVAAVVVFLTGVMVGRGVRLQKGGLTASETLADPTLDPAPPLAAPTGVTAQGPSPASREGLSYPEQLSELNPPEVLAEPAADPTAEVTGAAAARAAAADAKARAATPAPAAPKAADQKAADPKPADPKAPESRAAESKAPPAKVEEKPKAAEKPADVKAGAAKTGDAEAAKGFAVQVAAVRDRAEAERIVDRLKSKGYTAYITSPAPGMFRVRVGKFPQIDEANTVAAKLEKELQFKPWITR